MKIIVVGAGLSGLVSAMRLQEAGHEVVVLEARDRVGGRVLTVRDGFQDGQYADVGAMILYEGQENILELCRRFELDLTPAVTFGAELPALLFGGGLLDTDEVGAAFQELGTAHEQVPPVPFETVAAWARRAKLSANPYAFLEALIQIQPSIPLRYVDAHTLHLGPETFMQIAGGNDQLPRRIAEGLDVRLGAARAHDRLVGPGRDGRDREGDARGRCARRRRARPADDRARLGPAAASRQGRRPRLAALRQRRRRRDPVRGDGHGARRDQDRVSSPTGSRTGSWTCRPTSPGSRSWSSAS